MSIVQDTVTRLLIAWGHGDNAPLDRLIPIIHDELHRIARRRLRARETIAKRGGAAMRVTLVDDLAVSDAP